MEYTFMIEKGIGLASWQTKHTCYDMGDVKRFCDNQLQTIDAYSIAVFDDTGKYIGKMRRTFQTEWKDA